jgi:hypothetical protein
MSPRSVDTLWQEFGDRKPLVRLGLAPQLERAPQEMLTLLLAISLDQMLNARKLCHSIGVWRNHSISVWETSRPRCPILDSAHQLQQSHFCQVGMDGSRTRAELRSTTTSMTHRWWPSKGISTQLGPLGARSRVHDARVRRRFGCVSAVHGGSSAFSHEQLTTKDTINDNDRRNDKTHDS